MRLWCCVAQFKWQSEEQATGIGAVFRVAAGGWRGYQEPQVRFRPGGMSFLAIGCPRLWHCLLECAGGDFDIWRCVCLVGRLGANNLGPEGGKGIAAALQHTPNMQMLK